MRIFAIVTLVCCVSLASLVAAETKPAAAPADPTVEVGADDRALAEKAYGMAQDKTFNPAREFLNRLRHPRVSRLIKALREEKRVDKQLLAQNMWDVRRSVKLAETGAIWPVPSLVKVPHTTATIQIDGKVEETAWAKALVFHDTYLLNDPVKQKAPATTWRLLWDESFLYVASECDDTDIIAPERTRDGNAWEDDCVEIFLLPAFRFRSYWELIVTPSGAIYDATNCKSLSQWGGDADPSQTIDNLKTGIQLNGTLNKSDDKDTGYTVELAIPFAALPEYTRTRPAAGHKLHFNLARLDVNKGQKQKAYNWQPMLAWNHNIWNYGMLELAPAATPDTK